MSRQAANESFARHAQARLGVTVDGWAGARTKAAFDEALPPPEAQPQTPPSAEWDARSRASLQGVHADLVKVMDRARMIAPRFVVIEGLRTRTRQQELVSRGASRTMNSRHLTGHAVDIVPLDDRGRISWDWPLYYPLAEAVKQAAQDVGVPVTWGGDWRTFKDGPHWELPRNTYPA